MATKSNGFLSVVFSGESWQPFHDFMLEMCSTLQIKIHYHWRKMEGCTTLCPYFFKKKIMAGGKIIIKSEQKPIHYTKSSLEGGTHMLFNPV